MNRIDFYVLRDDDPEARWQFAGRLADKARRLGHQVLIVVDSAEAARQLDEFLWARPEESFLPHRVLGDPDAPPAGVEIAPADNLGEHTGVLVNLSQSVPEAFERFERLAEIVIQAPDVLKTTREHFGFYKARGYPVNHQKL